MNPRWTLPLIPLFGTAMLAWADANAAACRAFLLTGVECGGCVYMVESALRETKGVVSVQVNQGVDCRAVVTFDPFVAGEQKIAQSVRAATSLHGAPYSAQLKINVQGYARHADSVQAIFRRWTDSVRVEVIDMDKGELLLSFLPLKSGGASTWSPGWSLGLWEEAAKSGLPAGVTWECYKE